LAPSRRGAETYRGFHRADIREPIQLLLLVFRWLLVVRRSTPEQAMTSFYNIVENIPISATCPHQSSVIRCWASARAYVDYTRWISFTIDSVDPYMDVTTPLRSRVMKSRMPHQQGMVALNSSFEFGNPRRISARMAVLKRTRPDGRMEQATCS
jgi:hypothetical protein